MQVIFWSIFMDMDIVNTLQDFESKKTLKIKETFEANQTLLLRPFRSLRRDLIT